MDNFVIVKTFFHRHEAEMAHGLLEDAGVESIILADDCGGFRPDLTLGMNNFRLQVKDSDLSKAREALAVLE